jgi:hypothetical protein
MLRLRRVSLRSTQVDERSSDTWRRDAGTRGRIPNPGRAVVAGGGQPSGVRGDRHREHAAGLAGESVALGAGVDRPGFCAASFLVRKDGIMPSITTPRSRLGQCDLVTEHKEILVR